MTFQDALAMTIAQRDAEIVRLQAELLDHTGHLTRGLTRARTQELIASINFLRDANGWRRLSMKGRWRRRTVHVVSPHQDIVLLSPSVPEPKGHLA